jgi:transposase-like protein
MEHEPSGTAPRVQITCPGCGRHDRVNWPSDRAVYHWKCFNCGKEFDLTRKAAH